MAQPDHTTPVTSLEGARRRNSPASDVDLLRRLLDTHGEIVGAGLDLPRVVAVVLRRVAELTHADGAVIELADGDEFLYWSASGSLERSIGMRVKAQGSLSGLAKGSNSVLVCDDSETDSRVDRDACRRVGLRSMVVAPLPFGEHVVGVLKVASPWVKNFGPSDVRTLQLLNSLVGTAMANAAQHQEATAGLPVARSGDAIGRQVSRARIQRVIQSRNFETVFQPIVDLKTQDIAGYEALSRFLSTPARPPDQWFAEAALVGLGAELEVATAERAVRHLNLIDDGSYLAINISPEVDALARIEDLCRTVDARRIVLEITEHHVVSNYDSLLLYTQRLRELGVRVAIDDAGAGFASLRHILRLKPDLIKLDASLTRGVDVFQDHQRLVAALLAFANDSGAAIVAEGVESEAELGMLRSIGVAYGQGFYLGRPRLL